MLTSSLTRSVAIIVLLGVLCGLLVWNGSLGPAPAVGAYPGEEELAADHDRYLGQRVTVRGTVMETDPLIIATEPLPGERLEYTITGTRQRVATSDDVAVYGIAREDRTIAARKVVIYRGWGERYMYAVSFLAGLWVLGRLVRSWRFDRETWSLVPRKRSLSVRTILRTWLPDGMREDSDA